MQDRPFHLHDSRAGSAISVRVTPRASKNAVIEVLNEGTIRVHLTADNDEEKINRSLIDFLAKVLEVPAARLEIVAGRAGYDKLVSILDLDARQVQDRILKNLA